MDGDIIIRPTEESRCFSCTIHKEWGRVTYSLRRGYPQRWPPSDLVFNFSSLSTTMTAVSATMTVSSVFLQLGRFKIYSWLLQVLLLPLLLLTTKPWLRTKEKREERMKPLLTAAVGAKSEDEKREREKRVTNCGARTREKFGDNATTGTELIHRLYNLCGYSLPYVGR